MRLRYQIDVKNLYVIDYPTENAPEDFKQFMYEFLEWQSKKVIVRINDVIRRQLYNWHPLSDSYLQWKKQMGLDPRIYIASGQLLEAIHYWFLPSFGKPQFFIGVHPTKRHKGYNGKGKKRKTVRLVDILRWLEFGTSKMRPRPIFSKVFSEFKPKSVQAKLYAEFIKERKGL